MAKVKGILGLALGVFFVGTLNASVQLQNFTVEPSIPPPPAPALPKPQPSNPKVGVTTLNTLSTVDSSIDYTDLIRSQSAVGSLDGGLLGESIDYYTGQTDFVATDVSLPGNNALPVAVGRRYHVANHAGGVLAGAFGDWDLEIPHIEGVVATATGWTVPGAGTDSRCTYFAAPPATTVTTPNGTGTVTTSVPSSEYGVGYAIVVPGAGRHELLLRASGNTQSPGSGYPIVSQDWWASGCVQRAGVPLGNPPTPDEGFQVKSPTGVTYTFDQYSARSYPSYQRPADSTTAGLMATLPRQQVWMLPTNITDRFGNWVNYTYTTNGATLSLRTITSSDGRTITLSYSGDQVSSVSDGTRTWSYGYSAGSLSSVTLPDGSSWAINFATLNSTSWTYSGATCTSLPTPSFNSSASGTIRHPTGASGTFTFTVTRQGRNGAPSSCLSNSAGVQFAAVQPSVYDVLALTRKVITGPGISSLPWTLAYAGCSSSSCSASKTATVTDPLSHTTVYTFGATYNANADLDTEGQLQSKVSGSGLRTEQYTYYTASGHAYPSQAGTPAQVRGDLAPLTTLRPTQSVTTTVNGASYTQTMGSPDAYGYPTSITHQGSSSKTDTLSYNHNTTTWVLGTLYSKSDAAQEWYAYLNSYSQPTIIDRFGRQDRSMSYAGDGTLQSITDGASHTTYYSNYKRGIPQSITHPGGGSESLSVNNLGGISTWVDTLSHQTSYGFDSMGRLSSINPPAGYHSTNISWSTGSGGWTRTETRGSYSKIDTYDAFLHSTNTSETNNRIVNRTFDADGHATFVSYPYSSSGITSVYDALGQLKSQTDGGAYPITYTYGANALTVLDRNGESTLYNFLTYDGPSTAWPTYIAGPIATTNITRDSWGKPTSLQRGGVTRSRTYNSNQLLYTTTEPENGTTTYGYDGAANVTSINHNGASTETLGYDARNRLKSVSYSTGDPSVAMTWRTDSQLDTATRGNVTLTRGYDGAGLPTSESYVIGSATYDLTYGYDLDQHLSSLTYPDNTVINYNPNVFGQPTTSGSYATGASYYANGAINGFSYGNGIAHTSSQESRQLPYTVTDAGVYSYKYGYDGNANPTSITDQLSGTNTKALTYDAGNRLHTTNASSLWGNTTFTYDTQDNLTADSTGSLSYTIDGSNRLSNATIGGVSTALTYDTRGNLSQKGTGSTATNYTFDGSNELTKVVQGGNTYTYSYDASGRRATATTSVMGSSGLVPTLQVASIYDIGGHLVYEASTANPNPDLIFANGFEPAVSPSTTTKYFYLGSHAVAKDSKNGAIDTLLYLHTDPLGSPVAQTSTTGAIAGTTTYLPYGGRYASTGTGNSAGLGYSSHYLDASGLIYMRARYYDPQLHRFISGDPNGVDAGTALNYNRYSYAGNSPYAKYDPSGRESACVLRRSCAGNGIGSGSDIPMAVGGAAAIAVGAYVGAEVIGGAAAVLSPVAADMIAYGWINGFLANPYTVATVGGAAYETALMVGSGAFSPTSTASMGDLTEAEINQIQGVVNQAGRPLSVVGSAAQGARTAESDIDYVVGPSSLPHYDGLEGELPGIDPDHGIIPGYPNPDIGPSIPFEPTDFPDGDPFE
ncbi:RHS repeat domain-containing protein [Pseudolysobacter antarcticus]|nr:RHS repeat-associated core domain-containing protein [Pseudolysobacter antarcticus]